MHYQQFAFLTLPRFMEKPAQSSSSKAMSNPLRKYFQEESTIHGIRYLFDKRLHCLQKAIWAVLLLACFVGFAINTTNQLVLYWSVPVRVDLSVEYFNNMDFPDVTLCNFNKFRQSVASELGYHQRISELVSSVGNYTEITNETKEFFKNKINPKQFYLDLAHQKENFIFRCRFGGATCSSENFSAVFTNLGLCYRLNQSSEELLRLSESGVQNGLQLILNTETFDYFRLSTTRYGLKALVHSRTERARIENFGFSVPSGMQALTAVSVTKTKRIPFHGKRPCGEEELQLLKGIPYSFSACYDDCYYKAVVEKCGCLSLGVGDRDCVTNIGSNTTTVRYCDPYTYLSCATAAATELAQLDAVPCNCREKCELIEFQTSTSYATMGRVLFDKNDEYFLKMQDNLIRARNAHGREFHQHEELDIFDEALRAGNGLSKILPSLLTFPKCLKDVSNMVHEYEEMAFEAMSKFHEAYLEFLKPERLFLVNVYVANLWAMKPKLYSLQHLSTADREKEILNMKYTVEEIADDIKQRHQAGVSLVQKHPYLMQERLENSSEVYMNMSRSCLDNLAALLTIGVWEKGKIEEIDRQRHSCIDYQLLHEGIGRQYGRVYLKSYLDIMKRETIKLFEKFRVLKNPDMLAVAGNNSLMEYLGVSRHIKLLKPLYEDYVNENISHLQLAYDLTHGSLKSDIEYQIESQWQSAASYVQNIFDELAKTFSDAEQLGQQMHKLIKQYYSVTNTSLFDYYFQNNSTFTVLVKNCSVLVQEDFMAKQQHLEYHQAVWKSSVKRIFRRMTAFRKSCELDPLKVQYNFAELNIFYPELKRSNVIQLKAYGIWDLLSDVGGGMGLFLGASFLTMFEIFHVLVQGLLSGVVKRNANG